MKRIAIVTAVGALSLLAATGGTQPPVNDGYGDFVYVPAGPFKMGDNFGDGLPRERRYKDRCRQQSVAKPLLARLRHAIATSERQTQPPIALFLIFYFRQSINHLPAALFEVGRFGVEPRIVFRAAQRILSHTGLRCLTDARMEIRHQIVPFEVSF